MLDHTLIIWLNELGKGNSHTLTDVPFVLLGGKAHGIKSGRALHLGGTAHNRLWLTVAQSMGHNIDSFGRKEHCAEGPLNLG